MVAAFELLEATCIVVANSCSVQTGMMLPKRSTEFGGRSSTTSWYCRLHDAKRVSSLDFHAQKSKLPRSDSPVRHISETDWVCYAGYT